MYIRFVIADLDNDSGRRQGVFQALFELRDEGQLFDFEEDRLEEVVAWFDKNLKEPTTFRKSASKLNTVPKAISWFKDYASEHLSKMRDLISILEAHDITVEMIQTERPGYIVYEDSVQIAAEAFRDTGA